MTLGWVLSLNGSQQEYFCCFEFSEFSFCLLQQHGREYPWIPPESVASGVLMDVSVLGTRLQEGVNAGVVLNNPELLGESERGR